MKRCPHCAEEIQAAAVVCRFCNRDTRVEPRPSPPAGTRVIQVVAGIVLAVLALGVWGVMTSLSKTDGGAPAARASMATTGVVPMTWTPVATWSGRGIKETESFTTQSREWRIHWTTKATGVGAFLTITVHDADSGGIVSVAASQMGDGSDTSYVRGRPGRYYLAMNTFNADWAIRVEDQR